MSEWDDSDESSKQSVIAMGSTYTIPDITNGENLLGQTYTISGGALGNQSPISLGSDTRDTLTPVPVSPFPDNGSGTNTDTTSIKVRKDLAWWGCFSIANPSETSPKLKSPKDLLANDQLRNCQEFCTEHGSDTAMLCGKFQNNWTIMMNVIKQCDFVIFEFKVHFVQISYISSAPSFRAFILWHSKMILHQHHPSLFPLYHCTYI